jgi:hypothetical protein
VFNERTKTDDGRHFALEPVLRPLLAKMWAERPKPGLLFPRFTHLAEGLREDLMKAGVTRASLHVRRPGSQPIRFHDLRVSRTRLGAPPMRYGFAPRVRIRRGAAKVGMRPPQGSGGRVAPLVSGPDGFWIPRLWANPSSRERVGWVGRGPPRSPL